MGNAIGYYRRAVGIIIFREDGKMLVGQRSAKKADGIGTWQFPQGGYQGAETAQQAGSREMKEEVGLDASSLQLVMQFDHPFTYEHATWTHKGQTMDWLLYYWRDADVTKCDLTNEEVPEFTQLDFFDWDTILEKVVVFKLGLYKQLREAAEPCVQDFLRKIHTDDDHQHKTEGTS